MYKDATENKVLPSKTYWVSLIFISFMMVLTLMHRHWAQALVFAPLLIMVYMIGRYNQENRNPDKLG